VPEESPDSDAEIAVAVVPDTVEGVPNAIVALAQLFNEDEVL
jgi:hypothetical protein